MLYSRSGVLRKFHTDIDPIFPIRTIFIDSLGNWVYIPDREHKNLIAMSKPTTTWIELASANDLGAVIREARKTMALRQAEAALLCGVGIRYLSDLENGKETVRLGPALKVIAGLGLSLMIDRKKPFWSKDGRRT